MALNAPKTLISGQKTIKKIGQKYARTPEEKKASTVYNSQHKGLKEIEHLIHDANHLKRDCNEFKI